jgi:Phosphotransferase enzyme family
LESLNARQAVDLLSATTGTPYQLVGRLAGGETGAHECVDPDGRRVVVKWELAPASQVQRLCAVGLADRLREQAGWPVPRQTTVETGNCLFVIQDLLPGEPIARLTHSLVDRLLELHAARAGLEQPDDASRWPEQLIETLTIGGVGYCVHDSLRNHDARTARLIDRVEAIGYSVEADALTGHDIVHWDFHPGNVLEIDGRVSAVIDTDFVTTGDAAFDLATLAVSSLATDCEPGVRRRVLDLGVRGLDEPKRAAYVGHLLLRYLDWSIRKTRVEAVEFWLGAADRLFET